ncbi:MAG: hypothetical protein OXF01_14980 [Gemmatimonadetes bacterium]|nr:hypothetical protein [Gemmatimonadota bacterium]
MKRGALALLLVAACQASPTEPEDRQLVLECEHGPLRKTPDYIPADGFDLTLTWNRIAAPGASYTVLYGAGPHGCDPGLCSTGMAGSLTDPRDYNKWNGGGDRVIAATADTAMSVTVWTNGERELAHWRFKVRSPGLVKSAPVACKVAGL